MSRFTDARIELTHSYTKHNMPEYKLLDDMVYEIDHLGSGWKVSIPAGFRTDLASIGSWALKFETGIYVYSKLSKAAVVHDYLRKDLSKSKWIGDYVFWEAMGVDKVPMLIRIPAFLIVLINQSRY